MLRYNLLFWLIISVMIFILIEENEVHAAPEPCKELLNLMKPEKMTKPKDEKEEDDKHKRRKEHMKQFKKFLEMIMQSKPKKESEEVENVKPTGIMEDIVTGYLNFLKNLILL